jgi:protease-4
MIVFAIIVVLFITGWVIWIAAKVSNGKPALGSKAVLYIDLSTTLQEQSRKDEVAYFLGKDNAATPGLYDAVRLIRHAAADTTVKGIFIRCEENTSGFASSAELRKALMDFKSSGKFIYAFGDEISQKAYYVANVADHIYCNPVGTLEWTGLSAQIMYFKHALDKLGIEPQIFYDGKFKSATEPLRADKMSDANRLQTGEWLGDLNSELLNGALVRRNIDTATLSRYERDGAVQTAYDAVRYQLIDGTRYRDQVLSELRKKLGLSADDEINFVSLSKYYGITDLDNTEKDRIAVIYAEGDILYGSGKGGEPEIGSEDYVRWIREARKDSHVKAIVLRVNSPGGSSLASDIILRELEMAKKEGKPVVVSMGDYAASGGYYISCAGDSIFAQPGTITGSIGVFSIIPNLQSFFRDKLGVTFDGVKTAPFADEGNIGRPLTDVEKKFIQANVDSTYLEFKEHVARSRHLTVDQVEAIAQGRVWTGKRALQNGLVDRLGSIQDAIDCAARMVSLKTYSLTEYPKTKSPLDRIFSDYSNTVKTKAIMDEIGPDTYGVLRQMRRLKSMMGAVEVRLPYDIEIR